MGLIDLKTDLKSLRYGKDTLGGGYSGQPYIQTEIPDGFNDLGAREDFILRGGINAVRDSLTDIKRLGKMFIDTKSPNGLLFIAKQQLLSRTAVRTQTSGRTLNEGIYSPLNTLAQAGVIAGGYHLNKQGLNPFAETGAYATGANNLYLYNAKVTPFQEPKDNRLVLLYSGSLLGKNESYDINGLKLNDGQNVMVYTGGPGSLLGIGNTNIRYVSPINRTGLNNYQANSPTLKNYFYGKNQQRSVDRDNKQVGGLQVSTLTNINGKDTEKPWIKGNLYKLPSTTINTPQTGSLIVAPNPNGTSNFFTYTQQDIITSSLNPLSGNPSSPIIQDFRAVLRKKLGEGNGNINGLVTGATSKSLPYNGTEAGNIEKRVNLGDPGQRKDKYYGDYAQGVQKFNPANGIPNGSYYGNASLKGNVINASSKSPMGLDKINSLPIYRSQKVTDDKIVNDLVKFRIAVIDNNSPNFKTFLHFRAFLGPITDSYNSSWSGFNYLGRGEQFFTYSGFTRTMSLSWTVVAQSKQELIPMYKKLNYLASTLTPDYSPNGYMRGNLVQLTIGGYLYEQPGFITGLTYEMSDDSPWEIGIGTTPGSEDGTVKELTQIIRVSGFSFTPIQKFAPRKQQLTFGAKGTGFPTIEGPQQYIALSNGPNKINNNYYD